MTTKKLPQLLILVLTTLSIFLPNRVAAQDGSKYTKSIAFSKPINAITIDGKLNDWPKNTERYAIDTPLLQVKTDGLSDFSGYFMTGYNMEENAFYLAVSVEDNEHVLGTKEDDITLLDAYLLYFDEQHLKKGSGIARYMIAENKATNIDPADNWDPKMKKLASWDHVTYKTSVSGNTRVYELKLILEKPIYVGRVVGIGHLIIDKDQDKREFYVWQRQPKYTNSRPMNVETLVFVDHETKFGDVSGRVFWKDTTVKSMDPVGVFIHQKKQPKQHYYIPVNRQTGTFSTKLPEGEYELKPGKAAFFSGDTFFKADTLKTVDFEIKASNEAVNVALALAPVSKPKLVKSKNLLMKSDTKRGQAKIDRAIKAYMEYYQIEGVSFATFKGDRITYAKSYGVKNNYTKEPLNENTLFEFASVTKALFAFVVMRLHERGILDVNEPLYKHLPFEKSSNDEYNKLLTARHILSHKSGFPNWARSGNMKYEHKPGTQYGYSGEAFEYLKRVLVEVTNKDISTILKDELIIPLGLENMYFKHDEEAIKHKAHGHSDSYTHTRDMEKTVGVAHSLVSNPKSMAKFVMAIQNRKGLKPETYDLMLSKQTPLTKENSSNIWGYNEYIGFGFFIDEAPFGKVIRHGGFNGDFWSEIRLYDSLKMGYILVSNGNSGGFIRSNIERNLLDIEKLIKSSSK